MSKWVKMLLIGSVWITLFALLCYSPYLTPKNVENRHISILAWGDILDPLVLAQFEEKTGYKIHLSYYSSNEELLVKMKATEGEGYDLLIPSDYAVAKLIENNLIQPLQKNLITQTHKIDTELMGQFFDPTNTYSLPFAWEVFGLGYNKEMLSLEHPSWDLLFNPDLNFKYVMTGDPNEAIQFASFYLYGLKKKLLPAELPAVIDLLTSLRARTEAYACFRSDYFLATRSVPLVVASSSYIWRSIKNYPFIGFKIPDEGSFLTIENLCISKSSRNVLETHQLIEFLLSDSSMKQHFDTFSFFPSTLNTLSKINLTEDLKELLSHRDQLHYIGELTTQAAIQDAWVKIKVSSLP